MNWEKTDKLDAITIVGLSSSINLPTATESRASQVEMLRCQCHLQCSQPNNDKSGVKSSRYQHRRLLTNTPSPMLSWKHSHYAEGPSSKSKLIDYQEQTSSALTFHAASKLWTSDGLGHIRGDDMVPSPSRTDVVGYPSDMPATEVQRHNSPFRPLTPRSSGFAGLSSGLAGLDSYWYTPNHRSVRNRRSTVRRCSLPVVG